MGNVANIGSRSPAPDGRTHLTVVRQRPMRGGTSSPNRHLPHPRHRILLGLAALAVVGAGVLLAEIVRRPNVPAAHFAVAPVTRGELHPTVRGVARLEPLVLARVVVPADGRVDKVLVIPGQRVAAGAVLATMDRESLRLAVRRADAWLAGAEATAAEMKIRVNRALEELLERGEGQPGDDDRPPTDGEVSAAITYAQGAAAEAEVAARQATLRLAEAQLRVATVRAPTAGWVTGVAVTPGAPVRQGQPLVTISGAATRLRAVLRVGDADIGRVRVGQPVSFGALGLDGRAFAGEVVSVPLLSTAEELAAGFPVVVAVDNAGGELGAGMAGDVTVRIPGVTHVLRVPARALTFTPTGTVALPDPAVWTVRDGEPVRVPVQVGVRDGDLVEVRGDALFEGAPIIVSQQGGRS